MNTKVGSRIEKDSMGEMYVPHWALWGASTQRAVENFPVSGRGVPTEMIRAFGLVKAACAKVNRDLGKLDAELADAIISAALEMADGMFDQHFVVDVFQTGSGTSTNMNANEVIANRCSQKARMPIGSKQPVHPNDHVNMGQSSNDVFPTTMHVAGAKSLLDDLRPALVELHGTLERQAKKWDDILKIGRTHLMDATPIRVGQVFSGYASQAMHTIERVDRGIAMLRELAIGGTAVGTGINTHPEFGKRVAEELTLMTGIEFHEAANHFEAQATKDAFVEASGELKSVAVALSKIASDIRLLGSGPRCGPFELILPAIQPGSSIMPGKVNPVVCESVIQVAARVMGNDTAVAYGAFGGVGSILELNVAMPMMADAFMESVHILAHVSSVFVDKLLRGLEVNAHRCGELVERSLMLGTVLAPVIGYDKAAELAKEAFQKHRNIPDLVREKKLLSDKKLDALLNARAMTEPGVPGPPADDTHESELRTPHRAAEQKAATRTKRSTKRSPKAKKKAPTKKKTARRR